LTEGDSASGLALAGRAVVNPDLIGVFPLRGKLLNVRDESIDKIAKNSEIQNIKKFMGLQHKKEYSDTRGLRYGKLMIMTDQDHDGSHIKGLLINLFEVQFPSLLKIKNFLNVFITPIVKVWKGDPKHPKHAQSFFTMPEYEAWKKEPGHQKGWDHKYYKGLGTSSPEDAEVYFRDLDRHLKEFEPMKQEEAELIDMAFNKKKADARKNWLREFQIGTFHNMTQKKINYDDFVNKELILFSMADNLRSIPSVIDGLKPSQRKVLYTCFRRNLKKDVKVVELAGSVSGLTNYAYGETSMQQTIVGLAQNFVGSNNVNFLEPSGNFGSRRLGGKDAASARYIYTRLSPFARRVFHAADEPLLEYDEDDGKKIEPYHYVPVLPAILLNGADGIGTGWSTSIPNYRPEDIVDNIRRRMEGSKEDMVPMNPWFRGFTGEIVESGADRWKFSGRINHTGELEIEVTELPIRMWTQDFKDKLEEIIKAEKTPSFIKDYTEYNTPKTVHFIIKMEEKHMQNALSRGLEDTFKMTTSMATSNLVAFDAQGRIHKYETVLDIMEEFYHERLKFYGLRKKHQLEEMNKELDRMTNQARFVQMIIDNKLVVSRKKKQVLVAELQRLSFKPFPKVEDARKAGEFEAVVEEEESDESEEVQAGANDYDYLLGMAIWSLTQERVEKLLKQIGDKEVEIDALIKLSPKDIWNQDLDDFVTEWHAALDDEKKRAKKIAGLSRRASAKLGIEPSKSKGKKRKLDADSDDSDFDMKPKKTSKAQAKPNGLMSYFEKYTTEEKSVPPIVEAKSKPTKRVAQPKESAFSIDGASDPIDEDDVMVDALEEQPKAKLTPEPAKEKAPKAKTTAAKPKKAAKPAIPTPSDSISDEEDVFAAVAKEAKEKPAPAPARQARAATKKPAKYVLSDDSESDDNGDDLLGDISSMVKPIGNPTTARPMFSATTARPLSSHNSISKSTSKPKTVVDLSDNDDETDYTKLVPQGSPHKPAARTANETVFSEDAERDIDSDEAEFGIASKSSSKPLAKPAAKAKATAPAAAQAVPKKAAAAAVAPKEKSAPAPKKQTALSPAAKAYAAKQAKAAVVTKPAPKKQAAESDEESEDEVLANDILSDDEDETLASEPAVPAAAPAAARAGRPGRAAATKKSKYVISDDESGSEVNEASFEYDDESD